MTSLLLQASSGLAVAVKEPPGQLGAEQVGYSTAPSSLDARLRRRPRHLGPVWLRPAAAVPEVVGVAVRSLRSVLRD